MFFIVHLPVGDPSQCVQGLLWALWSVSPFRNYVHPHTPRRHLLSPSTASPALLSGQGKSGSPLHGGGPRTPGCGDTWDRRGWRMLGEGVLVVRLEEREMGHLVSGYLCVSKSGNHLVLMECIHLHNKMGSTVH